VSRRSTSTAEVALRVTAALLPTLPFALTSTALLATLLRLAPESRALLGMLLPIPLWITAMCWVFLTPNALRTWLVLSALSAVLFVLARTIGV
jgi:hypothetical protein